jgi:hypothetical protein
MSSEPPAFTLRFEFTGCKASTSATTGTGDVQFPLERRGARSRKSLVKCLAEGLAR